jgi:hypothetical protein
VCLSVILNSNVFKRTVKSFFCRNLGLHFNADLFPKTKSFCGKFNYKCEPLISRIMSGRYEEEHAMNNIRIK